MRGHFREVDMLGMVVDGCALGRGGMRGEKGNQLAKNVDSGSHLVRMRSMTVRVRRKRMDHDVSSSEESRDAYKGHRSSPVCGRSLSFRRDVMKAKKLRTPISTGEWNQ